MGVMGAGELSALFFFLNKVTKDIYEITSPMSKVSRYSTIGYFGLKKNGVVCYALCSVRF